MSDPFQLLGTTLAGKYRVDAVLGEGGYGVVYAGYHLILNAAVAIKLLKPVSGMGEGEAQATAQFLREARVLFGLNHPGIVRMYDVGEVSTRVGSVPYVVLEMLAGPGLDQEIAERRRTGRHFSAQELAAVFEPVLDALAFAHGRGVVHRDLKPSNVMAAKILDFGTARASPTDVSVGTTGFTPRYAAPEQWDPSFGGTGPGTDLFAMGLIVAEACTLEPAFAGDTQTQVLAQALSTTHRVTVAHRRPDLPPALDMWIARATRRPIHERFASAGEMLEAFRAALRGGHAELTQTAAPAHVLPAPVSTTGPRPVPSPTPWLVVAGIGAVVVLLLLALGVGGLLFYRRSREVTVTTTGTTDAGSPISHVPDVRPSADPQTVRPAASGTPPPPLPASPAAVAPRPARPAASGVDAGGPSAAVTTSASALSAPTAGFRTSRLVLASASVPEHGFIDVRFDPPLEGPPGEDFWITLVPAAAVPSAYGQYQYLKPGDAKCRVPATVAGDVEVRLHDGYPRLYTHLVARAKLNVFKPGAGVGDGGAPRHP